METHLTDTKLAIAAQIVVLMKNEVLKRITIEGFPSCKSP
jgi:hypothetical protein